MRNQIIIGVAVIVIAAALLWGAREIVRVIEEAATVPTKQVAFFALMDCPGGWDAYRSAEGRYVVGVAGGGKLEETVGAKLSPQESRPAGRHRHAFKFRHIRHRGDSPDGLDTKFKGNSNVKINVAGSDKTADYGDNAGTPAPYVQLRACIKR